jgi:hypothetical protein
LGNRRTAHSLSVCPSCVRRTGGHSGNSILSAPERSRHWEKRGSAQADSRLSGDAAGAVEPGGIRPDGKRGQNRRDAVCAFLEAIASRLACRRAVSGLPVDQHPDRRSPCGGRRPRHRPGQCPVRGHGLCPCVGVAAVARRPLRRPLRAPPDARRRPLGLHRRSGGRPPGPVGGVLIASRAMQGAGAALLAPAPR